MSADLHAECKRIDDLLFAHGGADMIIVGVGLNGHIGLNEPGSSFDNYCHISELAEITISTGQKYFSTNTPLSKGITIGLKHLLEAKTAILIATGERKAEIMSEIIDADVSETLPATVFKLHKNAYIWLDKAASKLIS
jgi:galactosamine-6-phosphate isomerase